eukprot:395473_1
MTAVVQYSSTINLPRQYVVYGYIRIMQQLFPDRAYYNILDEMIDIIFIYYFQDKTVKFKIKNEILELYEYYKPIKCIGSSAYSIVYSGIDERTQQKVAIKKYKYIFDDIRDAKRILKEYKVLAHFSKYNPLNVITIYDMIPPKESEMKTFEEAYIITPLMEASLCKVITSKQQLTSLHYKYITYQILRGLKFVHECSVIHKDIKPENIFVNSNSEVKIIGFDFFQQERIPTCEYVCTRWYRSPETMLCGGEQKQYNEKVDIWGVGCILAELILRKPLFPGQNYLDQIKLIIDTIGSPTNIEWILNDKAKTWVK